MANSEGRGQMFESSRARQYAVMAEIAEVLEHRTLAMVKQYSHLSDHHVSSVVSKMNEQIFGG
jgi:hypothetical protein